MFLAQGNQHIRKIFEGSCDTEDWSNENSGYNMLKKGTILLFYSIFNQINAALVSKRDFFETFEQ